MSTLSHCTTQKIYGNLEHDFSIRGATALLRLLRPSIEARGTEAGGLDRSSLGEFDEHFATRRSSWHRLAWKPRSNSATSAASSGNTSCCTCIRSIWESCDLRLHPVVDRDASEVWHLASPSELAQRSDENRFSRAWSKTNFSLHPSIAEVSC